MFSCTMPSGQAFRIGMLAATCGLSLSASVSAQAPAQNDPLGGWHTMAPDYDTNHALDGLSIEWDYHMIHDADGEFTGIIGYVLADPRRRIGDGRFEWGNVDLDLMPSGGNVAVVGKFADGSKLSSYTAFGTQTTVASGTDRTFSTTGAGGNFAKITPVRVAGQADKMILEGQNDKFKWNLTVSAQWGERYAAVDNNTDSPFSLVKSQGDIGIIPGESWNVDMLWPRTKVVGTITRRDNGKVINIDGHGYRENSWGRWAFVLGGWDFAILSDASSGVQWAWQSYHPAAESLDTLDVSFVQNGQVKLERFRTTDSTLGWYHTGWHFDFGGKQCVPDYATVIGQNARYRVEAKVISKQRTPLLSNETFVTSIYMIDEQFPTVSGKIIDRATGATVTTFSGQAGGEFAFHKTALPYIDPVSCTLWGTSLFREPLP